MVQHFEIEFVDLAKELAAAGSSLAFKRKAANDAIGHRFQFDNRVLVVESLNTIRHPTPATHRH